MKSKPERVRVVVEVDVDDVQSIETIRARAPLGASRSAVVRCALRTGLEAMLEHENTDTGAPHCAA